MGFYIRKSVSVGPFRFNLSKSGIGVSAGIKGFRVGSGPRGNYVHMGRGGIYYRSTLSGSNASPNVQHLSPNRERIQVENEVGNWKEIESSDILRMVDSSSKELLEELNYKQKKSQKWPFLVLLWIAGIIIAYSASLPTYLIGATFLCGFVATMIAAYFDQMGKSVVLFYEFDTEQEKAFQNLHEAFEKLKQCQKLWNIEASGNFRDWKRHGGALTAIQRKSVILSAEKPPYIKTNIAIPTIPAGRQTLYFFPDRLLVYDTNGVGAVDYKSLEVNISETRFVESSEVPSDAKIVDYAWQYINKNGDPDRRFKNNRKLPVTLYQEVHFKSKSGLNELFHCSMLDVAVMFKETIEALSHRLIAQLEEASESLQAAQLTLEVIEEEIGNRLRNAESKIKEIKENEDVLVPVHVSMPLGKNEVCYHETEAQLLHQKVADDKEEISKKTDGTLFLTSKRILFVSDGSIAIPLNKIIDLVLNIDRGFIAVTIDGRVNPFCISPADIYTVAVKIEKLIGRSKHKNSNSMENEDARSSNSNKEEKSQNKETP